MCSQLRIDMILHQYICDNKIDLCILTETWLTHSDIDKVWIIVPHLTVGVLEWINHIG